MEAVSLNGTVAFAIEANNREDGLQRIHTQWQFMAAGSSVNDTLMDL